jgi:hypothetical protein
MAFVHMAKVARCKFTFGTNNTGPDDLGHSTYGLSVVDEFRLEANDSFVPGEHGLKAALRKPGAFHRPQCGMLSLWNLS